MKIFSDISFVCTTSFKFRVSMRILLLWENELLLPIMYVMGTQKFLTDNFDSPSRNHSNINFSPKLKFVMFATLLYILRYISYKIACVCVQKNVIFASKKVSLILIYFFESLKDFELNNKII